MFLEMQAEAIKLKLQGDSAPDSDQPALLITSDQVETFRFSLHLQLIRFCILHVQLILSAGKGYGEQRDDKGKATECRRSQGIHHG